jgi:hypothetical protein
MAKKWLRYIVYTVFPRPCARDCFALWNLGVIMEMKWS